MILRGRYTDSLCTSPLAGSEEPTAEYTNGVCGPPDATAGAAVRSALFLGTCAAVDILHYSKADCGMQSTRPQPWQVTTAQIALDAAPCTAEPAPATTFSKRWCAPPPSCARCLGAGMRWCWRGSANDDDGACVSVSQLRGSCAFSRAACTDPALCRCRGCADPNCGAPTPAPTPSPTPSPTPNPTPAPTPHPTPPTPPPTPFPTRAPTPFGTDRRTRLYVMGHAGIEIFGTLANYSAAPAAAAPMPCFGGFGLPVCTQGMPRGAVNGAGSTGGGGGGGGGGGAAGGEAAAWRNDTGWHADMPPNYSVVSRPFCLQCCSNDPQRRDWYVSLRDTWQLRCRKGNWDIKVPAGTPQGGTMSLVNPWSQLTERVPLPAGVGVGQTYRREVGALPSERPAEQFHWRAGSHVQVGERYPAGAADQPQWEFRFLRRPTEGDLDTLARCNLTRRGGGGGGGGGSFIAGYELALDVREHRESTATWIGVEACHAVAIEAAVPPPFTEERITMTMVPLGAAAGSEVTYLAAAVSAFLFGAWCWGPGVLGRMKAKVWAKVCGQRYKIAAAVD